MNNGTYNYTGYVLFLNPDFMLLPLNLGLRLTTANLALPRKSGRGLLTHATLDGVWFRAISGSAIVYFSDGLGSGLYPDVRLFRR